MAPKSLAHTIRMTGQTVDRLEPWKDDGNVVLAAQGKHFRVHRSVLGAHSGVFRDMFATCTRPQENSKELIEQCPVVHLDDTASEVQIVLEALYDRSYPSPYYEKMPISVVAAFLRLGDKYAIPTLVNEAKAKLCGPVNPATKDNHFLRKPCLFELFPGIADSDPYNFKIMNLLEEMNMKAPLPLAMYRCVVTCPLADVAEGYTFNGSVCTLSRANLRAFMHMKGTLETFRIRLVKSLYKERDCDKVCCVRNMGLLWSENMTVAGLSTFGSCEWDRLFCKQCRVTVRASCERAMETAYNQLAQSFHFDSWQDVAKSGDFPSLKVLTER